MYLLTCSPVGATGQPPGKTPAHCRDPEVPLSVFDLLGPLMPLLRLITPSIFPHCSLHITNGRAGGAKIGPHCH